MRYSSYDISLFLFFNFSKKQGPPKKGAAPEAVREQMDTFKLGFGKVLPPGGEAVGEADG